MKKILLIPTTIAVVTAPLVSLVGCDQTKTPEVTPTAITLDKTVATIEVDETLQLTATIEPTDAEVELIWSSSDITVAMVTETGLIKAIKEGTSRITVKVAGYEDITASCDVTVEKKQVEVKLNIEPEDEEEEVRLESSSFFIQLGQQYHASIDIADDKIHKQETWTVIAFLVVLDNGQIPPEDSMAEFDVKSFIVDGRTFRKITSTPGPDDKDIYVCEKTHGGATIVEALSAENITNTSKITIDLEFLTTEPTGKKVYFGSRIE